MFVNRFDSETWVLSVTNKELRLLNDAVQGEGHEDATALYELEDALFDAVTELDTVSTTNYREASLEHRLQASQDFLAGILHYNAPQFSTGRVDDNLERAKIWAAGGIIEGHSVDDDGRS